MRCVTVWSEAQSLTELGELTAVDLDWSATDRLWRVLEHWHTLEVTPW